MKKTAKILLITGIILLALSIIYIGTVTIYTLYLDSQNAVAIIGGADLLVSLELTFMLYPFPTLPLILGAILIIISVILKKINSKNQQTVLK